MSTSRRNIGYKPPSSIEAAKDAAKAASPLLVILGVLAFISMALFFVLLGGVVTLFAWNIGLVAALGAFGVSVGTINLIEAIAIGFVLKRVGWIFRPRPTPQVNTKG